MPSLRNLRDYRTVRDLSFCYLCGEDFASDSALPTNRDHVPPKKMFASNHRQPLILPTHTSCNNAHKLVDEKMVQLVGLRRGYAPSDPTNHRLDIRVASAGTYGAVVNVDVHAAIWRWIRGFHAALYREPLREPISGALEPPFPSMKRDKIHLEPIREQHLAFVEAIKLNRAKANLDTIVTNHGNMTYECLWMQADNGGPWMCLFALDIYSWKDLGDPKLRQRGCAGFYVRPDRSFPAGAATAVHSPIVPTNAEPFDPFGR